MTGALVTATVGGQLCGIPVGEVEDVLGPQTLTHVPLAPPEVAGALNLRGRIVTALDMRVRMGLPPRRADEGGMSIVVARRGALYGLIVDSVADVLDPPPGALAAAPATLDAAWRGFSAGICRLGQGLMVVLDVDRLLDAGGDATIGDSQ